MPRFALDIEYDGRAFAGTQIQPGLRTLQQVLNEACSALDGATVAVRPASRLDAEVGAEHLPCDAAFARAWDAGDLARALMPRLPTDVVVRRAARVADGFHAQHDAVAKTYRYRVVVRGTRPVLDTRRWWVKEIERPEVLGDLAHMITGFRDLSGFACLRRDEKDLQDPHRRIDRAAWTTTTIDGDVELVFRVSGNGFLYKQVRGLVGAMIHVAQGRRTVDEFAAIVAGDTAVKRLGNIAPACGLTLEQVRYEPEPAWVEA